MPKDDHLCHSSPHRLRLLFHRSERGEGSRQNFLPLVQWLLFPSLPVVHHRGDFFRIFPIFSVSTQWGSWRKSLQEGLRLPTQQSQGFYRVLPVNTWPPAIHQSPQLNSYYLCLAQIKSVLQCPLPAVSVSPQSLGQLFALKSQHYNVFKENYEIVCPTFFQCKAGSKFPIFCISE